MTTTDQPHKHPLDEVIPPEAREHFRAARNELRESVAALLPPGFVEHRRAARREMLLAARSLLDAAIQHLEQQRKDKPV